MARPSGLSGHPMNPAFRQPWLRSAVTLGGAVFALIGLFGVVTLTAPVSVLHLVTAVTLLLAGLLIVGGVWGWPSLLFGAAVLLDFEAVLAGVVGASGAALSMVLPLISIGLIAPIASRRVMVAGYIGGGTAAFAGYLAALFLGPASSLPRIAPWPLLVIVVGGAIGLAVAVNWQATARWMAATGEARRELLARRALDSQLRSTSDRLESVLSAAPLAIASVDDSGSVRFWNAAAERIFGWPADEAVWRDLAAVTGVEPDELGVLLARTWEGEVVAGPAIAGHRRDGTLLALRLFLAPARDAGGGAAGATAIIEDVSAQRELEDQLRQSHKMETLGQLAGGVAHDFNNLLTAIRGFAEVASGSLGADEPVQSDLHEIRLAADRAANLTASLLVFGRRSVARPELVDLNGCVVGMLPMLQRLAGPTVTLETSLDPAVGEVRIDSGQLEQAILNLVVNARDALPAGGVIGIETAHQPREDPPSPDGHAWSVLAVRDAGVGMSPEVATRVFEPFFTTKPVGQGTGLGLAIVHGIISHAGGDVSVESAPGRGTTVRLALPAVPRGPEVPDPSPEASAGGTETVLLVEDGGPVRLLASRVLADHGYHVLLASDAAEARNLWEDHRATIDVLLADVTTPGPSGPDLARELLADRPDLRVVYMSGLVPGGLSAPLLPQPTRFLAKPFAVGDLLRVVRAALDDEHHARQPTAVDP